MTEQVATASDEPAAEAARAATIGQALRAARERAGLTLADVAQRTKVRPGILASIEADEHEALPSLTYSLGFVKAVARTVGMDPALAAERYRRESDRTPPVPQLIDLQPLDARRLPSPRLAAASTAVVVLAVGLTWAWGAGWFDAPLPVATPVETVAASSRTAGVATIAPVAAVPTGGAVVLTANDDVWMRVYDRISGRAAFNGLLARGRSFALPPVDAGSNGGWLLRTGRAGALDISVGGRAIVPLGGPADVVKHVPLDAAALLARGLRPTPPPVQAMASVPPPSAEPAGSGPAR